MNKINNLSGNLKINFKLCKAKRATVDKILKKTLQNHNRLNLKYTSLKQEQLEKNTNILRI